MREDLEGPECYNYYWSSRHSIWLMTTFLNQQGAQLKEVKEHYCFFNKPFCFD